MYDTYINLDQHLPITQTDFPLTFFFPELDPPQPVPPQSLRSSAERRHREVLVVDPQPRRQARQIHPTAVQHHRGGQVREEAGAFEEESGGGWSP